MLFCCTDMQPVKAAEVNTQTTDAAKRQFIGFSSLSACYRLWGHVPDRAIDALRTSGLRIGLRLAVSRLEGCASGEVATPIGVSLSSCLPSYTGSTSRMKLRSIASVGVFSRAQPGEANP
jgi:hypothetical protein